MSMRRIIGCIMLCTVLSVGVPITYNTQTGLSVSVVEAAVRVKGYFRKNGTYVQPHYRSNPDGNPYNNWSYPGNTNPYTGKTATGNPDTYLKNYYKDSSGGGGYMAPTPSADSTLKSIPTNAWGYGSSWYCNDGYTKRDNGCAKINVPANAWVMGDRWYCNDGYTKTGDSCTKVKVPANAWIMGDRWYCNDGYKKADDSCVKINVPANAWVMGDRWYCNDGYSKSGDSCVKINVPPNAWVMGDRWYCNYGYKRVGDTCVSN